MKLKAIGVVAALLAAASLASWGQAPAENEPAIAEQAGESTDRPDEAPHGPPGSGKGPAGHLTEAEDRESERQIRVESAALIAEYNAGNAEAFAGKFVLKGEYERDTGEVLVGRDAIQTYFAELFAAHSKASAHVRQRDIRLISLHTAIEEGTAAVADAEDSGEVECRFVAVWTFQEGRWRLASVREMTRDGHESDSAHERLRALEWLVGDWIDESPDSLVRTSCRWSVDGNFLLQDFTVKVEGADVMSGTQRIGWDPLTRKVRSWVFDSQGGFGEGLWNWDGERWIVRSSAVRSDGKIAASLNFIVPLGSDSYRWESSHRMSDDDPLPDISVLIVRQGPPPESTSPAPPEE